MAPALEPQQDDQRHSVMRPWLRAIPAVFAAALVSCQVGPASPFQSGEPTRIDGAVLLDGGRAIQIEFVGGREFDINDPCTTRYSAQADVVDDEIVVSVFRLPHPQSPAPNVACDAMGFSRSMTVQLGTAYTGNIVRDTTGQVFFLHRPSGMFNISGLPHGWKIRSEESLQSSPTGRWRQVFSPVASPGPNDPHVEFVQAFGAPADTTGADLQAPQRVNGAPTTYYLHKPTGEMVLVWQIGQDGVALVGNQAQFSLPQLISLAESIGPAE